jgi:hypothetical protein
MNGRAAARRVFAAGLARRFSFVPGQETRHAVCLRDTRCDRRRRVRHKQAGQAALGALPAYL